jgi:4-hydroxy-L-threonine phosphate dehydrogenase PdxA
MPDLSIIITSGEPAGVGPDIIAAIDPARFDARLVVIGRRLSSTAASRFRTGNSR